MAWIESHQELGAHPKVRKLARMLTISRPAVIGHLHFLWWWALDYAQDGDISRFDVEEIAEALLWDGEPQAIVDALVAVGFIECEGDARYIHDWQDYAGRLLQQRRANAEKQRNWRDRHKDDTPPVTSPQRNGYVTVTGPLRNGATVPNHTVPNLTIPTEPAEPDRLASPSPTESEDVEAIGASAPSRAQAATPSKKEKASPQPEAPQPETPENVTPIPTAPTARARDPIWDTFKDILDYEPTTKQERNKWGKCVKDIKDANGTPDEMRIRAARYIAKYGRDRLTVTALVSHWGEFAIEQQQRNGENYHNGHDSSHAGLAQRSDRPQGENRGDASQKQGEPTAEQRALQRKYAEQYGYAHRLDKANAAS